MPSQRLRSQLATTEGPRAGSALERYLAHNAPVGEHLTDQLLLPMLIAGGGAFMTAEPSAHLMSNIAVIEAFGMARVALEPLPDRGPVHWARVIVLG
jgi:RNA 3'-terminal phosphate cyclase